MHFTTQYLATLIKSSQHPCLQTILRQKQMNLDGNKYRQNVDYIQKTHDVTEHW